MKGLLGAGAKGELDHAAEGRGEEWVHSTWVCGPSTWVDNTTT